MTITGIATFLIGIILIAVSLIYYLSNVLLLFGMIISGGGVAFLFLGNRRRWE